MVLLWEIGKFEAPKNRKKRNTHVWIRYLAICIQGMVNRKVSVFVCVCICLNNDYYHLIGFRWVRRGWWWWLEDYGSVVVSYCINGRKSKVKGRLRIVGGLVWFSDARMKGAGQITHRPGRSLRIDWYLCEGATQTHKFGAYWRKDQKVTAWIRSKWGKDLLSVVWLLLECTHGRVIKLIGLVCDTQGDWSLSEDERNTICAWYFAYEGASI